MKRLSISIFILLIPVMIAFFLLDLSFEKQYSNSYKLKRENLEKSSSDMEVLVLGDSWGWNGIDPRYFQKKGFNLANPSQDLYVDQQLLDRYIDNLPALKIVLQSLSYRSLQYDIMQGRNYRVCLTIREFYILPKNPLELLRFDMCSLLTKESKDPFTNVFYWKKNLINYDYPSIVQENGWAKCELTLKPVLIDAQKRVTSHESQMIPALMPVNIQRLESMNRKLKERGIKMVLISLPVSKYYADSMKPGKFNEIYGEIKRLSQRKDIAYFDYLRDPRFSDEDFYNYDHMNYRGAEKISRIINQEIISTLVGHKN